MADMKPTELDFFRAGYDKTIDPATLLERAVKASKPKPTVFDLITQGYKEQK
jgi:hypothetical protein